MDVDPTLHRCPAHPVELDSAAGLILRSQRPSGEIPWAPGQKTDPWDHVEAAMGLAVAGHQAAAERAYDWMARSQLPDGSWYSAYLDGEPLDRTRDANFSAYVAVGVYHHFLVTGDRPFLERMWPTVAAAIDFALSLQAPQGEIHWAVSPEGRVDPMALLTGSSSVYMSLRCALAQAAVLRRPHPEWEQALGRLGRAIRLKPHLFNMTKARYSMDWFYPVLAGAITGAEAERRIERGWRRFVAEGLGVRCVSDRPWVAVAETTELVLALAGMGRLEQARVVFGWIADRRYEDGAYWAGFTFPDMTVWPEDRLTWTQAGVLLAADAIYRLTPGAGLFTPGAPGPLRG
ncbi:MAG TPA: phenyltransferase domain-containing protein [Desulfobacterales bacterium]|nr:phenyltransferase domain-containing protein [Desulfobacterales bacterium]